MDYSLLIMETVEMSLGEMDTTPRPARVFPLQSTALNLCFGVSVFRRPPFRRASGTIFIVGFRSRRRFGEKIDSNGASRPQMVGPTWPRNLAAWATLFWPSCLRLFASFAPTLCSFQKRMLVNFQVIWTSLGSLKHQNIENRVFCQCRVNSRKIGKL